MKQKTPICDSISHISRSFQNYIELKEHTLPVYPITMLKESIMNQELLRKYARTLLQSGVNLQEKANTHRIC